MLKLLPQDEHKFNDFKCGEVFCLTPTTYKVSCCCCHDKVNCDEFPKHFQDLHLEELKNIKNEENSSQAYDGAEDVFKESSSSELNTSFKNEDLLYEQPIALEDLEMVALDAEVGIIECEDSQRDDDSDNGKAEHCNGDDESGSARDEDWQEDDDGEDDSSDESKDEDEVFKSALAAYKCSYGTCERAFDNKRALQTHLRKVHLEKEKRGRKDSYPCTAANCKRVFKLQRSLTIHRRRRHAAEKEKSPTREKRVYKCDQCDKIFYNERMLQGHIRKHTGIFCDVCGKKFSQAGNMMRHKVRHTGVKAFKCKDCNYSFYTDTELKAHAMRHAGARPVICEICGKGCIDQGVLTAHMRRHTGERPAKCNICGKAFYSIYDLNVHSVAHTSERPFACDICGATFQLKRAVRVHKKIHTKHEPKPFVCNVCGKAFGQEKGLIFHMLTHKDNSARGSKVLTSINDDIKDDPTPGTTSTPQVQ